MATMLRRGSSGAYVSELQAALNFHIRRPAIPLRPDGIFGPKTEARLREFQAMARIQVDGIAGSETFRRLYQIAGGALQATVARAAPAEAARASRLAPISFPGPRQFPLPSAARPHLLSPPARQARLLSAPAFDVEGRLTFSPLDKDQPFKITLSPKINWPVFLPKPLKLDIETGTAGASGFTLDGKIKIPFSLVDTDRFELKPYFFAGAGVRQDGFSGACTCQAIFLNRYCRCVDTAGCPNSFSCSACSAFTSIAASSSIRSRRVFFMRQPHSHEGSPGPGYQLLR
jgi:hypothetical protein